MIQSVDPAELVRQGYEAFQHGGLRGWSRVLDPAVVFDMTTTGIPGLGVYRGRDEAIAFLEEWSSAFEPFEVELDEVTNIDERSALAIYSQRGRPAVGGAPVNMRYAQIVELGGGRIVTVRSYIDVDQARRAGELQRDPA